MTKKKAATEKLNPPLPKDGKSTSTEVKNGGAPVHCPDCPTDYRQFVTVDGKTTLRCKTCNAEVEPLDDGEANSLADDNK